MKYVNRQAIRILLLTLPYVATSAPRAESPSVDSSVYERAESMLARNLEPLVRNVFIVPHWIGTSDEFWYDRAVTGGTQLVIVDATTGKRRVASADEESKLKKAAATPLVTDGVLPSPDGHRSITTREGNLWLVSSAGGPDKPLTQDGNPDAGYGIWPDIWQSNFIPRQRAGKPTAPIETRWAPDSRTLLVPFIDQSKVAHVPFIETVPSDGGFRPRVHQVRMALIGEKPATFAWRLIDTDTGSSRNVDLPYDQLLDLSADITAFRDAWWSRDSKRLYLVAHGENMKSAMLFEVDVASGTSRTVLEERIEPRTDLNSTPYNPVNVRVVRDGRELIWFSQRDGWGHLYRYNIASGKLLNRITSGNWLVRDIIDIDERRGLIYFTGSGREPGNPYFRYLYRVRLDGTDLKLLSPKQADHLLLPRGSIVLSYDGITPYKPVSPSGKYVIYNHSSVNEPTRFVIRRVADASLVAEVERADATQLYATGWQPPEEFVAKAADGKTELWGVIYKPRDFDPNRRYPIIDVQYASPLTAFAPRHFAAAYRARAGFAAYAELGFIVVVVDARGTTYRSREFLHSGYGELNRIGLDDHVAVIRSLAAERSYMDADRVGIVGHSFGGYAALRAMLEFPEVFKAGIASAAPMDVPGMYADFHWSSFQGTPMYSDGSRWRLSPTEIPSNYRSLHASSMAERLRGKLLIQLGELDENVPPSQILSFVQTLITLNKDFELLYLPGRSHAFAAEGYVIRRNWDFMVRNLLEAEPPREYRMKSLGR